MKFGFKKALTGLALAGSLLATTQASAASAIDGILSSNELKVCFEAGYIPFEMKTKDGRFIGFDIDLGKHMARSMDVKFVPVNTAWDGIIPALQTEKCDIIMGGMTVTAQRNLKVMFSNPYITIGQTVVIKPELKGTITSYKDLNNPKYTITSQIGTTGAEAAKKYLPKAKLDLFETSADGVLQVANGKADAFVYDLPFNALYSSQHKDTVVHLDESFTYEPLGWAIRQDDPNFLNFLNNYLTQIKNDGTYDRIYSKWFESDSWVDSIQ
ncbi:transporter substrate-binding domain-containing protein [Marinomonas mediterranea]|jgi:amino acid ABC transporter substrate-binding protein, PAAT family (TC 3.A.1.3.-)|uniref:ABC-type transporter, periplasmic subunit family 3 n=1 Tax=Marinomonas mediterranea (strain ATCC 700492 / JCM 21426 / NBRC 103028 / MMB-1) TaxID=717774 RepID=F2JYK8_MARM1|nr:transporter substrate-binding domain-containing protein [Marinomonas mediterranea]ADZ93137.1 ABC-type transporter, periplasmic subunit family 3 [Marinomonas mediterranea MMB-1]WCN11045.1 transporter substrate-binding domain-containing protein [Marinomonas mediterranea]WCN15103.1 transporter substrate-binding domain-containing protein [Marinomonas mediterranea]WCN19146.1 transporter substrate-binding domain-containing protein [Marinomonas mediterranea MMB-1]